MVEIAHTKARFRRALLPKLRLDLMRDITHKTSFLPAPGCGAGTTVRNSIATGERIRYPEGYHAFSRQNACSAALSPRKMLRSAFRMLATDFGNRLRGRKLHLPSPQYCHIRQVRQGAVFRGSAW